MISKTLYYEYGYETSSEVANDLSCAKEVHYEKTVTKSIVKTRHPLGQDVAREVRYFIKYSLDGLFNPVTYNKSHHYVFTKKGTYKWHRVNKECFDMYLQFLRTSKAQFFNYAQRMAV